MFTLKVENKNKQILTLTQNESNYQIISVEGLNPPEAEIYTKMIAGVDGERYKSSRLQMRNLVLTVRINGDVEENRIHLYEFFATGKWCKIYYSNDSRDVFIEGYCEKNEGSLFTDNQQIQISIVCPDPYFKSLLKIYSDISKQFGNFEFPFAIEEEGIEFSILDLAREVVVVNGGEIDSGAIITLTATHPVPNPIIYNVNTLEYLKINEIMQTGEVIIINTSKGNKSIEKIYNGVTTNAINMIDVGSTWLQLEVGANKFTYSADANEEALIVEIEGNLLYEGV